MVFLPVFDPCACLSVFQSEKLLLFDTVQSELEEKIRRLEEDRHSIDITSGTNEGCSPQLSKILFFDPFSFHYLVNKMSKKKLSPQ